MAGEQYQEELTLKFDQFMQGLDTVAAGLQGFTDEANKAITGLAKEFDDAKESVIKFGKAFAVLASIPASLLAIARSTGRAAEEIDQLSQKTGLSIEQAQGWLVQLNRVGLGSESLAFMMRTLSANMEQAKDGASEAAARFRALGVTQADLKKGDLNEILLKTADGFKGMEHSAAKSRLQLELLGRVGMSLGPAFNNGLRGIEGAFAAAKKFGALSEAQVAIAAALDDKFDDMGMALRGLKNQFGALITGALIPAIDVFTDLIVLVKDIATGPIFGELLKKTVQGWSIIFVLLVGVLEEVKILLGGIGAGIASIFAGPIKQAPARLKAALAAMNDDLDKEGVKLQKRIMDIMNPGPGAGAGRKSKVPNKTKGEPVKEAEAILKASTAEVDAVQALVKSKYELLRIEEERANLFATVDPVRAAKIEAQFAANELKEMANLNTKKIFLLKVYEQEVLATMGENEEQKKLFMAQIAEQIKAIDRETIDAMNKNAAAGARTVIDTEKQKYEVAKKYSEMRSQAMAEAFKEQISLAENELEKVKLNYGTAEQVAQAEIKLLQWKMDQEISVLEVGSLQEATIRQKYAILIEKQERISQDSFKEGWKQAWYDYANNLNSTFNLATDMARKTAEAMAQGFKTFFFDLFEGRIKNLKDVLRSFADFAKQIIAEVIARVITAKLVTAGVSALTSLFGVTGAHESSGVATFGNSNAPGGQFMVNMPKGEAGGKVQKFAVGGPVFSNDDTVPAMLKSGEYVLSNKGVSLLDRLNQGNLPFGGRLDVHIHNAPQGTVADGVSMRKEMEGMVVDIILKNRDQRGPLKKAF